MNQYFTKRYEPFRRDIHVKVDLSNYATKADLKIATRIDTSKLALKSNLANLKAEVNKIDGDKFKNVPVELSKLSNVVNNDFVQKIVYDKLVAKVSNIDTSGFVLKTKPDTDKSELEKKVPDTSVIVKKAIYNAEIIDIENKIPPISGLATNSALTAVENKIHDTSNLVQKQIMIQKLMKSKIKLLIMIMINILLLQNLIS